MGERPVRLPPELEDVPPRPLEDYVRARLVQFAGAFAARACPQLGAADVRAAAAAAIARLPPPLLGDGRSAAGGASGAGDGPRELQLVFRHDCLSLGCLDPHCALCEHNPRRRCSVNFAPKYLVNDVLRAKCDAAIRVEVIDRASGLPAPAADLRGVALEVCVLDGNAYDARCVESGAEREGDLEACALLLNNRGAPLLAFGGGGGSGAAAAGAGAAAAAGAGGAAAAPSSSSAASPFGAAVGVGGASHAPDGRVLLPLGRGPGGAVPLPDLHVTDSSEAMLSGRKPPFRLLVRAVFKDGSAAAAAAGGGNSRKDGELPPPARHAVSEGFVVATRRTRTAGKVEIPNVDDHVSKLEHMGKETVKKLQDIAGSARASGIDLGGPHQRPLPDNCVESVGAFRRLALLAEGDGHLRQRLQAVLKLSKEKWDDARDHALRAVVADSRMRIWYAPESVGGGSGSGGSGSDGNNNNGGGAPPAADGLLFAARLGDVDLDRPVGVLHRKRRDGGGSSADAAAALEATLAAQQTPAQREAVRALRPVAAAAWWQPGHPGWAIYPADSDAFLASGGGGGGASSSAAAALLSPLHALPSAAAAAAAAHHYQAAAAPAPPPVSASGRPVRATAAASASGRGAAAAAAAAAAQAAAAAAQAGGPMAAASPFARAVEVGGAATVSSQQQQQQHYAHHHHHQQQQQQQHQQQQPSLGGPLPSFGGGSGVPLPTATTTNAASGLAGVFSGALMTDIARMHSTGLEGGVGAVLAVPPGPPPGGGRGGGGGSDLPSAASAAAAAAAQQAAADAAAMPPPPPMTHRSSNPAAAAAAAATPFGAVSNGTPFAAAAAARGSGAGAGGAAAGAGAEQQRGAAPAAGVATVPSGALRAPSLGIGRLDSLDLDPDGVMGTAPSGGLGGMLGSLGGSGRPSGSLLPPVVVGGGGHGGGHGGHGGGGLAGAMSYGVVSNNPPSTNANGGAPNAMMGRAESGLESMQSIEEALGSVRGGGGGGNGGGGGGRGGNNTAGGAAGGGGADVIDRVAREWKQQQEEAAAAAAAAAQAQQQQQQQW